MSENYPKISVIIPTYNRTHLVGRAINLTTLLIRDVQ